MLQSDGSLYALIEMICRVKGALYSLLIWLPMRFNLFYNLQMVLTNVLYFFTRSKLTLVHSLVQTQLLNLL